jgi:hypothetical protein
MNRRHRSKKTWPKIRIMMILAWKIEKELGIGGKNEKLRENGIEMATGLVIIIMIRKKLWIEVKNK